MWKDQEMAIQVLSTPQTNDPTLHRENDIERFERIDDLRRACAQQEMEFLGVDTADLEWVFTLAKERLILADRQTWKQHTGSAYVASGSAYLVGEGNNGRYYRTTSNLAG
jgi:hypothetical protein